MISIKDYIMNNKGLLIVILIITAIISGFTFWKINNCFNEKNSIKNQLEETEKNNSEFLTEARNNDIQIKDGGFYLTHEDGSIICGPYKMIFDDDSYFDIIRFIDQKSGLIGYMSKIDGKIIVKPKFKQATSFQDGPAMVSENGKEVYYISSDGKKIGNTSFLNGFPFEAQGFYARVQFHDDKSWGIINREGKVIVHGFQSINVLPEITTIGSGIKNDHVILFMISNNQDKEYVEIENYSNFCDIYVYGDIFGLVKNSQNLYGLVRAYDGKVIALAKYTKITWHDISSSNDDTNKKEIVFILQKEDGTYDVIIY